MPSKPTAPNAQEQRRAAAILATRKRYASILQNAITTIKEGNSASRVEALGVIKHHLRTDPCVPRYFRLKMTLLVVQVKGNRNEELGYVMGEMVAENRNLLDGEEEDFLTEEQLTEIRRKMNVLLHRPEKPRSGKGKGGKDPMSSSQASDGVEGVDLGFQLIQAGGVRERFEIVEAARELEEQACKATGEYEIVEEEVGERSEMLTTSETSAPPLNATLNMIDMLSGLFTAWAD